MSFVSNAVSSIFGGGSSGGSQPVQTQVNSSEPWSGVKTHLTDLYDRSKDLSQTPQTYFPGETVTPFSGDTQAGMGQVRSMASQPNQLADGASQGVQGILDRGGYSQNFDQYAAPMMGIADGGTAIDTSRMQGIADGGMLGQNPYIDQLVDQVSQDATGAVNRNAFFKGREGSDYHAGEVARQVGNISSQIRGQDYAQERGYMDGAMNSLANTQGANIANQYQASQGLLGADSMAQQTLGQAASMAPTVDQFGYANAGRLMDLGQIQEGKTAEGIQDEIARFQFGQNEESDRLARYAAMIQGGGMLSNSSQSTYAPAPTPTGAGILGGALGGAQLGTMLGNPLLGAAGGALMGLF